MENTKHIHTHSATPAPPHPTTLILAHGMAACIQCVIGHRAMRLDAHLTGVLWVDVLGVVGGVAKPPAHFSRRGKGQVGRTVSVRFPHQFIQAP